MHTHSRIYMHRFITDTNTESKLVASFSNATTPFAAVY